MLNNPVTIRPVQPAPAVSVSATQDQFKTNLQMVDAVANKQIEVVPIQQLSVTAKLEQVRWINPELAAKIATLRTSLDGTPRSRIAVPICPSSEVTDEVLFESPADATKKFYLPRYRIAERNQQVQMSLASSPQGASGQGWSLTIHLEKYPAASVREQARGAREIDHSVSVILQHRLILGNANGGHRELVFEQLTLEAEGVRAILQVSSLSERDLLYQVLTYPDYGGVLIIRRTVNVAVPLPTSNSSSQPATSSSNLPTPQLQLMGTETYEAGGKQWTRYRLSVTNQSVFPDDLFAPAPDLPPCGLNRNAARTWVDIYAQGGAYLYGFCALSSATSLNSLWFAVAKDQLPPTSVYITLNDRRLNRLYTSNSVSTSGTSGENGSGLLFREVTRVVDDAVNRNPFVFPVSLYPYIFKGITGAIDNRFKPDLRQVDGHSYYQDPVQRYIFYYLPDRFKLARRPESPHYPMVSIRFFSTDGSAEEIQVTIEYWAYPFVDATRLALAAIKLNKYITGSLPADVPGLVFQPLLADKPRLFLGLPQADGSLINKECPEVLVELRTGFRDSRTLSLQAFQSVYDALFSGTTQLFQGQIRVDFPDGPSEIIPFSAQMDDLVGEHFDYSKEIDAINGVVKVTLKNAIESPIRIDRLSASLRHGDTQIPGVMNSLSVGLPAELKPGEGISFTVTPKEAIASTVLSDVVFDLSGVKVLPDQAAVWRSILRPDSPARYKRLIAVTTSKGVFGAQIAVILVNFKHGDSCDFNRDDPRAQPTAAIKVLTPISDLILRKEDFGTYEYRITLILKNGQKVQDPLNQWRTETSERLWITSDELPKIGS
ncbi:hypothetical protein ACKFKF_34795 [Phormidesmis sp. 146-12]